MMKRVFLVGALVTSVAGCDGESAASNQPSDPALDAEESALLYEVDRLREGSGIPGALIVCKALNSSASLHSDDMRDKGYVAEKAPDGTNVRARACKAGYAPGCGDTASMAELVAGGITQGAAVVKKWSENADAKAVLLNTTIVTAGAGRSLSADGTPFWTLDLGGKDDPSCK